MTCALQSSADALTTGRLREAIGASHTVAALIEAGGRGGPSTSALQLSTRHGALQEAISVSACVRHLLTTDGQNICDGARMGSERVAAAAASVECLLEAMDPTVLLLATTTVIARAEVLAPESLCLTSFLTQFQS
ncbi:MAG: hypothetical protein WDW38_005983 [Sanguina aurantia]